MSGLDHVFDRTKDFGLTYPRRRVPGPVRWASARSRSTRSTCSAPTARSPTAASRCRAGSSTRSSTPSGKTVWPTPDDDADRARSVISPQAAYIITDILAGNTDRQGQPVLGQVGDLRRQDPPAGRLQDRHDQRQPRRGRVRLPRPAGRQERRRPSPSASGWATATTRPNDGKLSLDTSAPLWSAILTEVSKGEPIAQFKPPERPQDRHGRRLHRPQARPVHDQDGHRAVPAGHRPDAEARRSGSRLTIDAARGLLWQDGCAGPKVTRGFFNLSEVEANFPAWQKADANWAARAARGLGRPRRPEGHRARRTSTTARSRRSAGPGARRSRRRALCPLVRRRRRLRPVRARRRTPSARRRRRSASRRRRRPAGRRTRRPTPQADGDPAPDADAGRPSRQNSTIVAPSPPSPRWPGRTT